VIPVQARDFSMIGTRQGGVAFVVALVFLLVLTILGVSAVNSSIMQGLMSASYQQQAITLAGAENLLLEAEADIDDLVANGVGGRDYFIDLVAAPGAGFPVSDLAQAWPNDYVVEYMGPFTVPGESAAEGGGLEDRELHIFRISARRARTDDERGGLRIVQSLYVTLDGPDV
jgi:type IV pilus assembly protein PilX